MNNNELISKRITDMNHCVAELAKRKLTILDIKISDVTKPVITIIGYNATPGGLQGGFIHRITKHQRRFETYATELEGCQVQWKVIA